jgi:hypothetical protein
MLGVSIWTRRLNASSTTRRNARSFFLGDRDVTGLHPKTFPELTASHARTFAQPRDRIAKVEQLSRNCVLRVNRHLADMKLFQVVFHK